MDDWRDNWIVPCPWHWLHSEHEAAYFAGLYEETRRLRRNEGRFFGPSPVETAAFERIDRDVCPEAGAAQTSASSSSFRGGPSEHSG